MDAQQQVKRVVSSWYGVPDMPMTMRTKEEEIREFVLSNPEFPFEIWALVNHNARLFRLWLRDDLDLDLVVWDKSTMSYRMIQEVCFKDAFPKILDWHQAIQSVLQTSDRVWVVYHQG